MNKAMSIACIVLFSLAMMLGGCSSTAAEFCDKLATCTILSGISKDECEERTQKVLDAYTSGQREDCEKAMEKCLEMSDCANFKACYQNLGC